MDYYEKWMRRFYEDCAGTGNSIGVDDLKRVLDNAPPRHADHYEEFIRRAHDHCASFGESITLTASDLQKVIDQADKFSVPSALSDITALLKEIDDRMTSSSFQSASFDTRCNIAGQLLEKCTDLLRKLDARSEQS